MERKGKDRVSQSKIKGGRESERTSERQKDGLMIVNKERQKNRYRGRKTESEKFFILMTGRVSPGCLYSGTKRQHTVSLSLH